MDTPKRRRHTSTILALAVLAPVMGYVVYSSLDVSQYQCDVCMTFDGQQTCRTVTGKTEQEGIRTGITNACAMLTSGMTNSMRCERGEPAKAQCKKI